MWTCSKCNARVEPAFDVCWRCGTTYRGEEDPDFVTADESPPIEDPTDYLRLEAGKLAEEELPGPPLELACCFEGRSVIDAKFVADLLMAEGIPAALQNTARAGDTTADASVGHHCRVVVRAEDLARAWPIAEGYRERQRSRADRRR